MKELSNQVLFLEIKNNEEKKVYQKNENEISRSLNELFTSFPYLSQKSNASCFDSNQDFLSGRY